jgi:hypothetical protein
MSTHGIDAATVRQIAMDAAEAVVAREIGQLRAELHSEIARLESEMREIGRMIVAEMRNQTASLGQHIDQQTVAVVGGVATNTAMLERTRTQIESDFSATRDTIGLQTEANLQVEVGKKIADSVALRSKLRAFSKDVRSRFDKSIEGVFLNRQLYNLNFDRIRLEFDSKLKSIGAHIFRIRDADIAPAIKAAQSPLQEIHSLPIEVDQMRLRSRSQQLERSVDILRDCGFERLRTAQERLEETLSTTYAVTPAGGATQASVSVVALRVSSALSDDVYVGRTAGKVETGRSTRLPATSPDMADFVRHAGTALAAAARTREARPPSDGEAARLGQAARRLAAAGLVSTEAVTLFEDFLGSGKLMLVR